MPLFDSLQHIPEQLKAFLVQMLEVREKKSAEQARHKRLDARFNELLSSIRDHPDMARVNLAMLVLIGQSNIPTGRSKEPYWQRVAQMRRQLNPFNPYEQQVQWLEVANPMLEELLGEAHQEI